MAKKNGMGVLIVIAVLLIGGWFLMKGGIGGTQAVTGSETMTRTLPTQYVTPGSTFTLTYNAVGTSGSWFASVVDSSSGGCKYPNGASSLSTVMTSADGQTLQLTMTAPTTPGTCTFSGDYKYGDKAIKTFTAQSVQICAPVCNYPDACATSVANGCGGTCTRTVLKNTIADTNCDNSISNAELMVVINAWKAGTVSRNDLGMVGQAWSAQ